VSLTQDVASLEERLDDPPPDSDSDDVVDDNDDAVDSDASDASDTSPTAVFSQEMIYSCMPAPTDFDSDDDVNSDEGHYGTPYCGRDASDASDTSPIDLFSKEMIYSCMSDPIVETWGETTPTAPMTPTTALFPGYIPWVSHVGSPPSIVIPWNRGFKDVGVSFTLAQVVA
jgi:hypothetical protein